jgi:Tfp pilus assembly protein FimT
MTTYAVVAVSLLSLSAMVRFPIGARRRAECGFSLIDQLMTVAAIAVVAAMAVPSITNAFENQRLGMEMRNVERELQSARLDAVNANHPIRVRFNCPSAGKYRRVELIGSIDAENAGDDADAQAAVRCGYTKYPYPAPDKDPLTRPNNDGPIMMLNTKVTFLQVQTLEFWSDGTVHISNNASPWPPVPTTLATLKLTKGASTKSITVNSLGKIQIQ